MFTDRLLAFWLRSYLCNYLIARTRRSQQLLIHFWQTNQLTTKPLELLGAAKIIQITMVICEVFDKQIEQNPANSWHQWGLLSNGPNVSLWKSISEKEKKKITLFFPKIILILCWSFWINLYTEPHCRRKRIQW